MYKTVKCRLCSSFLFVRKPTQLGCHRFPVLFQIISGRTAKSRVISSRSERKLEVSGFFSPTEKRKSIISSQAFIFEGLVKNGHIFAKTNADSNVESLFLVLFCDPASTSGATVKTPAQETGGISCY